MVEYLRSRIWWQGKDAPKLLIAFILIVGALIAFDSAMQRRAEQAKTGAGYRNMPSPFAQFESTPAATDKLPDIATQGRPRTAPSGRLAAPRPVSIADLSSAVDVAATDVPVIETLKAMPLLEGVERDGNGNIVIDIPTLRLLSKAIRAQAANPQASSLAIVESLIEAELPGAAGDRARDMFMLLLEYQAAEDVLLSREGTAQPVTGSDKSRQAWVLRDSYFGPQVAAQLFREAEQVSRGGLAHSDGAKGVSAGY